MSEVRLVVREAGQDWSGTIHGSAADLAVAALSADPVTLAELKMAATRFVKPDPRWELFGNLRPGSRDEPWDAGLVVIDLVARLVIVDSTYSSPGPSGSIGYHDRENGTTVGLPYHLADDWQFVSCSETGEYVAKTRRRERLGKSPLDARAVLYGLPLLEYLASETLAAFHRGTATAADDADRLYDTLKNIHAAWLLTPRDDLQGACPREVMREQHEHLMWDLQDRSQQWSRLGECRPAWRRRLSHSATAVSGRMSW
jgi:hypothetical protein